MITVYPRMGGRLATAASGFSLNTGRNQPTLNGPARKRGQRKQRWLTPAFAGFFIYVFVTTTARFRIADVGIILGLVGLLVQGKKLWFPGYLKWFLGLVLWSVFSLAWSLYPAMSSLIILDKVKIWVIMLLGANAVRTSRQLQIFLGSFLFLYLAYPARGITLNYIRGITTTGRVGLSTGVLSNPNYLAAACLVPMSVCAALLVRSKDKNWRLAYAGIMAWLAGAMAITQSRGGLIALMVFAGLAVSRSRRRVQALVSVLVLGVLVVLFAPKEAWERLGGLSKANRQEGVAGVDPEGSAAMRYQIILNAIDVIEDHPVFGTGIGTWPAVNAQYNPALGRVDTHNTYLNVFAETGFVGIVLFLGMIGAVLKYANAQARSIMRIAPPTSTAIRLCGAGLIGFLVASIWGTFPYFQFLHFHMLILLLMARIWPADDIARLQEVPSAPAVPAEAPDLYSSVAQAIDARR